MINARTRTNFYFYLSAHVARYAFPVVLTPFLAHFLMKDGFGEFAVVNSCIWTASVFVEFGFYVYGINRVAAAEGIEAIGHEASAIVSGKLALVPVCILVYATLIWTSGELARAPVASGLGLLSAVANGATFAWYFQGRQRGATAVALEGVPQLVQLLLLLLLIRSREQLWQVVLIQALTPLTAVACSVLLMRREGVRFHIHLRGVGPTLSAAKPYFIERICFTLYTAVTPTMIAMLSSVGEAATYSIGDKVGIFLGSLAMPITQTMIPVISQLTSKQASAWRLPLLVVGFTVLLCAVAAGCVAVTISYAVGLLFSSAYAPAIPVARIFCVMSIFACISMALSNFVILPRGAAGVLIWSATAGLCVSLVVQVLLVPHLGAAGAAWARTAAELTTALILTVRTVQLYRESRSVVPDGALQEAD